MRLLLFVLAFVFVFSFNVLAQGNAENGAKLFKKNCKICHKKDGSKSKLSKSIKGFSLEKLSIAIEGKSTDVSKKYKMMVRSMKKKKFREKETPCSHAGAWEQEKIHFLSVLSG